MSVIDIHCFKRLPRPNLSWDGKAKLIFNPNLLMTLRLLFGMNLVSFDGPRFSTATS
jgi:hypothetical protein